jgi:GGDEF domain-containing protein
MAQAVETLRLIGDTQGVVSGADREASFPREGIRDGVTDWDAVRNYRRMLQDALSSAQQAREDLTDAQRRIATLEHLSRTDETTGLLNRRGFDLALETALARVRRQGECGVLVMIDLDGFKAINDQHGHRVGDLVLATVGTVLNRHTRFTDSAARIGGG